MCVLRIGARPRVRIGLWLVTVRLEVVVFEASFLLVLAAKLRESPAKLGLLDSHPQRRRRAIYLVRIELVDVLHTEVF